MMRYLKEWESSGDLSKESQDGRNRRRKKQRKEGRSKKRRSKRRRKKKKRPKNRMIIGHKKSSRESREILE